ALKNMIGDPANSSSGIKQNGGTNWEDGFLRMLRNVDGSIPAQLPSKVIFFTDGVPTYSRKNGTSSTAPVVDDALDAGLPAATGSSFAQIGWNRAERVVRDRGKVDVIGIFVGTLPTNTTTHMPDTAYEDWYTASGYHIAYARGNTVYYQRQGNVVFDRGYHLGYQRGNNVVYERGQHIDYQRGNTVSWQYATTGVTFEQYKSNKWQTDTASHYLSNNKTPDATDNYRITVTGPLGGWTTMTSAQYDKSNSVAGPTEGVRTSTGTTTSWTSISLADYNLSNTTADASDGFQIGTAYTAPYDTWVTTTQALYETAGNNSTADSSDGWRTTENVASTSWTTVTAAQYNASNTTADATDGWQTTNIYTAPFDTWEPTTQAVYDTAGNNSTSDSTDGWRTRLSGSSSSWTTISAALYGASNTTADSSDGFRSNTSGTSTSWVDVAQAEYDASNTTSDSTDGWKNYHNYSQPFTGYDTTTKAVSDIDLLGNVIVGDLSGNTGPYNRVDPPAGGAPYADNAAAAADVFALPDYSRFADALDKIVLGECGGTVTLQTKNTADGLGAKDPFTYQNSTDNTVVKTSSAFKSGTFDIAFPGENAKTITITPQEFTNLSAWTHVSWSCKSKGVAYPFTETPVSGHAPWTSIQLVVHANEAISCTQMVSYHG
ncbi:MAG: hypothetical protein ABI949_00530, partial [Ilumatobacteraceae bacterium]